MTYRKPTEATVDFLVRKVGTCAAGRKAASDWSDFAKT
jgi:hypothetical protein